MAHDLGGPLTDRLLAAIPFEPTEAQRRAMHEIGDAMAAPRPMNVLLQGDVGAGKTLVALDAALVAIGSGHQAAIMAPTEVLAGQHLRSVQALLAGMDGVPYLQYAASRSSTPAGGGDQASLLDALELDGETPRDVGVEPALTYALLTAAVTARTASASSTGWPMAVSTSWSARTPWCRRRSPSPTSASPWWTSSIASGCTSAPR